VKAVKSDKDCLIAALNLKPRYKVVHRGGVKAEFFSLQGVWKRLHERHSPVLLSGDVIGWL
jgi:hypothetical protein